MAAAITVSPAAATPGQAVTVSGTGFANNTAYTITATAGVNATRISVTSDGSGAWSFTWPVGVERLRWTFSARPATEHTGGTAAAATATLN